MKKSLLLIIILFILASILTSCATTDFPGRHSSDSLFICFIDKYSPGFVERYQNTQNLEKIKNGMTKEQVFKIMGEPLMYESYSLPNIWFYYTDWDWADCAKTNVECTPLIFEKGKLVGWGRAFYKKYSHKDWIFNSDSFFDQNQIEG
jgi:hypothetical protein